MIAHPTLRGLLYIDRFGGAERPHYPCIRDPLPKVYPQTSSLNLLAINPQLELFKPLTILKSRIFKSRILLSSYCMSAIDKMVNKTQIQAPAFTELTF